MLPPSFEEIYDKHASFVWRSARRLGVTSDVAEDVVQDVFLVVHRRLAEFEGRSSMRTWLFGIVLNAVRNHRRSLCREQIDRGDDADGALARAPARTHDEPDRQTEQAQAVQLLYRLLDELEDQKREVFVMADLEQMRGTEIAAATGLNQNTVYARLKAARQDFERAVTRHRARCERRAR